MGMAMEMGMCRQACGGGLEELPVVHAGDTAFPGWLDWEDCMEEGMGMGMRMGVVIGIRIGTGMGATPVPTERPPQKITASGVCCSLTRG